MEQIKTRQQLIEHLFNSAHIEKLAKEAYESDMQKIQDKHLIEKIREIRDEEIEHEKIIKDLVKLLSH